MLGSKVANMEHEVAELARDVRELKVRVQELYVITRSQRLAIAELQDDLTMFMLHYGLEIGVAEPVPAIPAIPAHRVIVEVQDKKKKKTQ